MASSRAAVLLLLAACACRSLADSSWRFDVASKADAVRQASNGMGFDDNGQENPGKLKDMFESWAQEQGLSFDSAQQSQKAFQNFKANMKEVWRVNRDPALPYWLSGNAFSHMDYAEFSSTILTRIDLPSRHLSSRKLLAGNGNGNNGNGNGNPVDPNVDAPGGSGRNKSPKPSPSPSPSPSPKPSPSPSPSPTPTPTSTVNWVAAGKVGAIRDQGQCGSCWAFAATSVIESQYLISVGGDVSTLNLSEQQMVSCVTASSGCNGGSSAAALDYVYTVGQTTEARYPYSTTTGTCNTNIVGSSGPGNMVKLANGHITVSPSKSVAALKTAVAKAPTVFYFMVDSTWQSYRGGIYVPSTCTASINHAMVAVGYDEGEGSWLVRNSWGTGWGEAGYARVTIQGDGAGPCGMYQYAYQAPGFSSAPLA